MSSPGTTQIALASPRRGSPMSAQANGLGTEPARIPQPRRGDTNSIVIIPPTDVVRRRLQLPRWGDIDLRGTTKVHVPVYSLSFLRHLDRQQGKPG